MSNSASGLQFGHTLSKQPWLRSRWLRYSFIGVLLLVLGGFGVRQLLVILAERSAPPLLTQPVEQKTVTVTITANGTVEAERSINLSPKTAGVIQTLLVEEGDRVRQGEVLAVMDDANLRGQLTEAQGQLVQQEANLQRVLAGDRPQETAQTQARLRSAQAELEMAEADLISDEMLYEAGAISRQSYQQTVTARNVAQAAVDEAQQTVALSQIGTRQEEIDQARAQVIAAQGSLETIQTQLDETSVLAPFDGVVVNTYADVGSFVSPSTSGAGNDSDLSSSILELASDQLEVVVNIAESQIGQIQLGQTVQIRVDAFPGEIFTGVVDQIAPRATVSQNVTSFEVQIAVDTATSDALAIGMNVEAEFEVSRLEDALLVPNAAVIRQAEGTGVYVLGEDGDPVFQPIDTGLTAEGQTEVLSGLDEGEPVLVSPPTQPADRPSGFSLPEPPAVP
ncbi:efflux RND transporter periplasmic adaptor subunit [Vacuolonema iberomarrocanum]|uniref:efflux RND transporter periplasmic adaptor subunit n=1 Tax=Vacuolonema iberomarrocanum TaxID=3454632 RepID=UPI003F6E0534